MRKAALFVLALALVAAAWELYKALGPATGGDVFGWRILPRTNDNAMPHVWDMVSRLFDPESRTYDPESWQYAGHRGDTDTYEAEVKRQTREFEAKGPAPLDQVISHGH